MNKTIALGLAAAALSIGAVSVGTASTAEAGYGHRSYGHKTFHRSYGHRTYGYGHRTYRHYGHRHYGYKRVYRYAPVCSAWGWVRRNPTSCRWFTRAHPKAGLAKCWACAPPSFTATRYSCRWYSVLSAQYLAPPRCSGPWQRWCLPAA